MKTKLNGKLISWIVVMAFAVLTFSLRTHFPWLIKPPVDWVIPVADWINSFMYWFVPNFKWIFRAINWLLTWPMNWLQEFFQWLPWPITITGLIATAYAAKGWRLSLFTAIALMYMVIVGYWSESMNTLALVAISVPISLIIGIVIGVMAHKWPFLKLIVQPMLELMQTFPTFAYLIPILFLFGFGPVVGMIASAIYAIPPMVHNVMLGLSRVPVEVIESAKMSGATPGQLLWTVEMPVARPSILVGYNQTTMAALSMVIIAAVIGGYADIGWEVLNTMRKALFGQSFLAGTVIVLLAMIMDRITRGFSNQDRFSGNQTVSFFNRRLFIITIVLATGALLVLAEIFTFVREYPKSWTIYPVAPLNGIVNYLNAEYFELLDSIKNSVMFYFMLPLRIGLDKAISPYTWGFEFTTTMRIIYMAVLYGITCLSYWKWGWRLSVGILLVGSQIFVGMTGIPWPAFVLIVSLLAYQVGGWKTSCFAFTGLLFMVLTGFWGKAMLSLYLCAAAVLVSFVLGSALGILAAFNDRFSAFIRPINDTLQTMPLFVFLIPVVMFFQVGDFSAFLAIIMYAIVPAIRYVEHGIRQVPADVIEATIAQGCTRSQILWNVQLPMALPEIMLGLNQTIIFALAMLIIAALVGTNGLGQEIYKSLTAGNVGKGFVVAIGISLIAMISDRIIQAWANKRKRQLGLF